MFIIDFTYIELHYLMLTLITYIQVKLNLENYTRYKYIKSDLQLYLNLTIHRVLNTGGYFELLNILFRSIEFS